MGSEHPISSWWLYGIERLSGGGWEINLDLSDSWRFAIPNSTSWLRSTERTYQTQRWVLIWEGNLRWSFPSGKSWIEFPNLGKIESDQIGSIFLRDIIYFRKINCY